MVQIYLVPFQASKVQMYRDVLTRTLEESQRSVQINKLVLTPVYAANLDLEGKCMNSKACINRFLFASFGPKKKLLEISFALTP